MSVLNAPRIHFRGKFTVNPATMDNDDVRMAIDSTNVKLLPTIETKTDPEALSWLMSGVPATSPVNGETFEYLRGGWNPFGTLGISFLDVQVCSTVGLHGDFSTLDAIVGSWVSIKGSPDVLATPALRELSPPSSPKLVDLDPTGSALTQLYIGGFQVGDMTFGISATCDRKAFGRWVAFRNAMTYPGEQNFPGAGAVWQFSIPNSCLHFHIPGNATPSVLEELKEAAGHAKGIVVQFATYQVVPQLTDDQLIALLEDPNNGTNNPATGIIVGTVGVWKEGESATVPVGRLLLPDEGLKLLEGDIPLAASVLGPALALVHHKRDVVTLNLIGTFPENGYTPPLQKADFGPVRLGVIPSESDEVIPISEPIDYDYATYCLTGGIIDVEYDTDIVDRATLEGGILVLLADAPEDEDPILLLSEMEQVVTVVSVGDDDTGYYLNTGGGTMLSLVVTERGGPPSSDVEVYLWEFQYVTNPPAPLQRAVSILHEVGTGIVQHHRLHFPASVTYHAGHTAPLDIPVGAKHPGAAVIAFTLDGIPPLGPYPWATAIYTGVRVLPHDDYSGVAPAERVSWKFMFETVFRYYYLIFPAMSKIIPFNNQFAMEHAAQEIVDWTDPLYRDNTRFMPVSRDLSAGKRALIVEWANSLKNNPQAPAIPNPMRRLWL